MPVTKRLRLPTLRSFHRFLGSRLARLLTVLFVFVNLIEVLQIQRRLAVPQTTGATPPQGSRRIFIASLHWNNEEILRKHWNDAVVALAEALGPENVFVSVFESGSWDNSKAALMELDKRLEKLGVSRNITLSETTHLDEISNPSPGPGWVKTSKKTTELRRIPYLARLRNVALQHLQDLFHQGIRFDKVLFLNDVVFTTQDVMALLNTNEGQYAAACSMDFSKPPLYYDTFALRDVEGHEHVMQTWPYFRARASRLAMKANLPVPVASCWNGMVAMPTESFVTSTKLRFRGTSDSLAAYHVDGSECCLIHADNPLSVKHGVFLNPQVRVGYNGNSYQVVNPSGSWLSSWQILTGLWENRLRRWFTSPMLKEWTIGRRLRRWNRKNKGSLEPGGFCLINEMQVLVKNGWAHV